VPDFEAEGFHDKGFKKYKLSDFRGKWVILFFYPADFTFVCPTELEELAKHHHKFSEIGAEIFSVSTDTVYAHKAWHESSDAIGKVKFPMLSDSKKELVNMFGICTEEEGLSLRGTFIIDTNGTLKAMEVNDNSIGRSARELLRKLQAAQFVSKHNGQVCPASWEPGEDTLTPSADLVGKI
jgi:peroxiredoxin (alkyl hydroperoxide reductase subunit C)